MERKGQSEESIKLKVEKRKLPKQNNRKETDFLKNE